MSDAFKLCVGLCVLALVGCGGTAGSDSRALTAQDCRAYYEYTYKLDGMDATQILGDEQLAKDSQTCADTGMVTKRHYDCAMAAKSVADLQACGAPNT
jgi:hypothetical protein